MGKDIHYLIIQFLENGLRNHSKVEEIINITNEDYYIYRIKRKSDLRDVLILLSDEYYYGEFEYLSRPPELNDGGFILIAKPEAQFPDDSQENHIEDKMIIGKIGVLFGALRINDFWTYQKPTEDNKKKYQGR